MITCPSCAETWPDNTTFCGSCGTKLAASMTEALPPAPPPPPLAEGGFVPAPTAAGAPSPRSAGGLAGIPTLVLALLLGAASAFVSWILIVQADVPGSIFDNGLRWQYFVLTSVIYGLTIGAASALVVQRSSSARPARIGPDLAIVAGCALGGGVLAGALEFLLNDNFWLYKWFEPSSTEEFRAVGRLQDVLVFGILGVAVGVGCALTRRVSALVIVATAAGGVLAGLLRYQIGINLAEIHDIVSSADAIALLVAVVVCVPICLAVGLVAQVMRAPHMVPPRAPSTPTALAPSGANPTTVYTGAPPYQRTNGFAIASLVLGLICGALLAVIFGHIALSQIKRSENTERGRGMAIAGLVLGYVQIGASIILWIALVAASSGSSY